MAGVEVTGDGAVEVGVGDEVVIRLPENATTGYVWSVESIGPGLEVMDDTTVPPGEAAPGAAGERLFRVRAVSPARADVVLRLARSWESGPGMQRRRVTVTARG